MYMRKFRFYLVIFTLIVSGTSCDDGDIDISSFEFEETVNYCKTDIYTLYRLSTDGHREALILTLTDKQIRQDEVEVTPVNISPNGPVSITDRVFESEVDKNYFCAVLPPIEPKVKRDWRGVSGSVRVRNMPVYDPDSGQLLEYEHVIVLSNVVLESKGETIILNDTYLYGSFKTKVEVTP